MRKLVLAAGLLALLALGAVFEFGSSKPAFADKEGAQPPVPAPAPQPEPVPEDATAKSVAGPKAPVKMPLFLSMYSAQDVFDISLADKSKGFTGWVVVQDIRRSKTGEFYLRTEAPVYPLDGVQNPERSLVVLVRCVAGGWSINFDNLLTVNPTTHEVTSTTYKWAWSAQVPTSGEFGFTSIASRKLVPR